MVKPVHPDDSSPRRTSVHQYNGNGLPPKPKLPTSRRLTVGLVVVTVVGVVLLVLGTVKNYGPLYTAGGIWLGFAFGVHKARQHFKRVLEAKVRTGGRG